jgi:O-Antigen ligase
MAHEARSERARLTRSERRARLAAARPTSRSLAGVFFGFPPVALLGASLVLAFRGGGIVSDQWAPVAVGTAVVLVALGAVGSIPRIPRQAWPAFAALAGLFIWGALSLIWSPAPEATLETVARLGLLVLAAVVGASFAARPGVAQGVAVALAAAGALLVVVIEVKVLAGSTGAFSTTRLIWPIDYANGNAALVWLALPALLAGAAVERIRPAGRALVAALAALTLAVGLMTLSRGGTIALVVTLVVCVAITTDRPRLALTLAGVVLPVIALFPRLTGGRPGEVASDATARGWAAAIGALAAGVIVLALGAIERARPRGFERQGRTVAIAIWASALVLGGTAFVVHYGRPDTWLTARWHEFQHPESAPASASRFGNATSNRYDYWRVAVHTFANHPLDGEGAGAFGVPWFRHRAISESVTDAHSWELGTLAESGIVGFLLLVAALVLPLVQLARGRRELGTFASVALGGCAAYFVLHASVDWLFLIPAVAVPAFVALGACAASAELPELRLAPGWQRAAVAGGALVATLAAVPVYLSTTLITRAESQAAASTNRALDTLSLAARANPWAVQPKIVRTQVLLDAKRTREAISTAKQATRRAPQMWITWQALADAERAAGDDAAAAHASARAHALNPKGG